MSLPSDFADNFSKFAHGRRSLDEFNAWLKDQIVALVARGEPKGDRLSFPFLCLMHIDYVADPKGPEHDETEARRLAGSLCAIGSQFTDRDELTILAHLARWAPATSQGIHQFLAGQHSRAAFEEFLSRRRWWPHGLRVLVKELNRDQLASVAAGMDDDDYQAVAAAMDSAVT